MEQRTSGHPQVTFRMRAIVEKITQAAPTDVTVLILGERGTGKDFVARQIHSASQRQGQPFTKVNCAGVSLDRLESDLFGHEKGAFPEAHRRKLGKFEYANKGSIFLDGIGELPPPLEGELLRVLRDHRVSRIGGREMIRVDVRVIASTTPRPEGSQSTAAFWEELRALPLVEIHLPPLRERRDEIPALASLFLARFNQYYLRNAALSPETLAVFTEYAWPGNIRELENVVRRLVIAGDPRQIHEEIQSRLVS